MTSHKKTEFTCNAFIYTVKQIKYKSAEAQMPMLRSGLLDNI